MLYCNDSQPARFPPYVATPKGERPDPNRDRCTRDGCGKVAWQHWVVKP